MKKTTDHQLRIRKISPEIYHFVFSTQYLMNASLLRICEHDEHVWFKGKIFTWEEFMDWEGNNNKEFNYLSKVLGHNLTHYNFAPFIQGNFDPLTKKEKIIVNLLKEKQQPYSVIATYGSGKDSFMHEVAHALFFTDPEYKRKVTEIVEPLQAEDLKKYLKNRGYHSSVFVDEIHAFLTESYGLAFLRKRANIDTSKYKKIHSELKSVFDKHVPHGWNDLEKNTIGTYLLSTSSL